MTTFSPWVRSRGFGRLLAQETNISDLLQFLSDRDSAPWADLVGFVPKIVERESLEANADLLLVADDRRAAVEVKAGHVMDAEQQGRYELLSDKTGLFLAALSIDRRRLEADSTSRWRFLSLAEVFEAWVDVDDQVSRVLSREAVLVLREWDTQLSAVFAPLEDEGGKPLNVLTKKSLAKAVSRRIEIELRDRGRTTRSGVTSGGGLPLVQAWTPIRGETEDRSFIAEVRWREKKQGGELRFGVDFGHRPGEAENEEVRRAAYDLSCSMDDRIDAAALKLHLEASDPRLAKLLNRENSSRPVARGDWEQVMRHGFAGAHLPDGKRNNRQRTSPAFFGDGAMRFQAIADIDFACAGGQDIADLLDATLSYLADVQPG
ncbi:hypothetical protein E3O47_07640 [Cryobacterium sp. TMT2-17-1]|uniref:hypothetical protein n=1 Tax=Cryobacterium sp. TMT2-17-1 TaxID=1259248 RepID=UPI00106C7ED7|nr:hypothetical protein [Cryobacterium sp. TMT2-17-1]TFC50870.1 hypothetical protein E3O47_07640 [Cryobacterium sp. TMT2-17-1]